MSLLAGNAQALGTSVLSNFGQPSSGAVLDLGVRDLEAIPFTTDGSFTELDFIEVTANTLFAPGGLIVSIWTVDNSDPSNLKPGSFLTALRGPSAPQGLERYSGRQPPSFTPLSLQPATSYFIVLSIENGGSKVVIDTIDANGTDASPTPLYQFGTDTDGNGSV
ncbi:choice-of-anchor R domain-containing protein, partial [Marinobacter alexandrii]|uniref:choice-of-anchor R domain-containing protein n=1 Tax=Marinobacter alexandrii TaxID=2570351 RepID=UPI0032968461